MPLSFNSFYARASGHNDSPHERRGVRLCPRSSPHSLGLWAILAQGYRPQETENKRIAVFSAPCLAPCVENRLKHGTLIRADLFDVQ